MKKRIVVLLWVIASVCVFSEELKFRFAPPDGTEYVQTTKQTQIKTVGGVTTTTIYIGSTNVKITRNEDGYILNYKPIEYTFTVNGKESKNPAFDILTKTEFNYIVSNDAELISVSGLEVISKYIADLTSKSNNPALKKFLEQMLSQEALVKKEKDEWNAKITSYALNTLDTGYEFGSTDSYALPDGSELSYYSLVTIPEVVSIDGHRCADIKFFYNSDPAKFESYLNKTVNEIFKDPKAFEKADYTNLVFVGMGERLVEPETMLFFKDDDRKKISFEQKTSSDGKVIKIEMITEIENTFKYKK